jgi:hypothetical protein
LAPYTIFPAAAWISHAHRELVNDIHAEWATTASFVETPFAWEEVFEDHMWTEFKKDVAHVRNFGVSYASLLQKTWNYAKKQTPDIRQEITSRLAEEILDGFGMCEQGKITRLTNVLRGFHTALEDIVVLSVGEQLQNRMAVVGALPVEERQSAAEATFAELGILSGEQPAWLEAVLNA